MSFNFSDMKMTDSLLGGGFWGCVCFRLGNLRFNSNMASSVVHPTQLDRHVLCSVCGASPTTATATTVPACGSACSTAGSCDGVTRCIVTSEEACNAAAATLGLADTVASKVSSTQLPPGCWVSFKGNLRFNNLFSSTVVWETQGQKQVG